MSGKATRKCPKQRINLPKRAKDALSEWLYEHLDYPYPTEDEKRVLAVQTDLSFDQVRESAQCNASRRHYTVAVATDRCYLVVSRWARLSRPPSSHAFGDARISHSHFHARARP